MTRKELAEAILKGIDAPGVQESRGDYIHTYDVHEGAPCYACALGLALIGKHDGDFALAERAFSEVERKNPNRPSLDDMAEALSVDAELAAQIEEKHFDFKSARRVAEWLMEVE